MTWSSQPSLRSAVTAPRATPASAPMTPVTKTSTAELMILGSTEPHTGSPLARDRPRLPVNSPDIQIQYWSSSPRFRCRATSSARTRAGVASCPSIAYAALPGSTSVARNTTTDTRNRVTTPTASRRQTMRAIGCAPAGAAGRAGADAMATARSASGTPCHRGPRWRGLARRRFLPVWCGRVREDLSRDYVICSGTSTSESGQCEPSGRRAGVPSA